MLKYNKAQYFNIQSTYREIYFRLSWVSLPATSVTPLKISELPMFLFFLWQEFGKLSYFLGGEPHQILSPIDILPTLLERHDDTLCYPTIERR